MNAPTCFFKICQSPKCTRKRQIRHEHAKVNKAKITFSILFMGTAERTGKKQTKFGPMSQLYRKTHGLWTGQSA